MLCSWLNCYSWHPKPVVAQDSVSEAHVPECSFLEDGGQNQLWPSFAGCGAGSGPAAGQNRTGAGIRMLRYLLSAQLIPMSGRQVSRFL